MGSLDSGSLGTGSLEGIELDQISELLKLGMTAIDFITKLGSLS